MPTLPPTNPSTDTVASPKMTSRHDYLEAYAEQDAILGSPNPRYKQSSIYASRYLDVRVKLVGTESLTDAEWDLTIF